MPLSSKKIKNTQYRNRAITRFLYLEKITSSLSISLQHNIESDQKLMPECLNTQGQSNACNSC